MSNLERRAKSYASIHLSGEDAPFVNFEEILLEYRKNNEIKFEIDNIHVNYNITYTKKQEIANEQKTKK